MKLYKISFRIFQMSLMLILCLMCGQANGQGTIISTVAGNGTYGYTGDGGPATSAEFRRVSGLVFDAAGNYYVSDYNNNVVRKVSLTNIITTIAGNGTAGSSGDGGQATNARIQHPVNLAMDTAGNLYIGSYDANRIRMVTPAGIISTFAGTGLLGFAGDGGPATDAYFDSPSGLAIDSAGNVYVADAFNRRVRKIDHYGIITTVAGDGTTGSGGDGGPATDAQLTDDYEVAFDRHGNLYIGDAGNNKIRIVTTDGIIHTFAGTGTAGFSGDGGQATNAKLNNPPGIAVDTAGNVYIADQYNERIRKVAPGGIITTIAGNGYAGYSGDSCAATSATLDSSNVVVAVDPGGNVYICDNSNNVVRMLSNNPELYFPGGLAHNIVFCSGITVDSLDSFLVVQDSLSGQFVHWSVAVSPLHGTVFVSDSAISTGGLLTPTGAYYEPSTGYTGYDTFKIKIADCGGASDTMIFYIHINQSPTAIAGPDSVCAGATITLSDTITGGLWSSSNPTIAIVGSATGIVTGIAAGTATITYALPTGCNATITITVNPLPEVITGIETLCPGDTFTLSDASGGGTWVSLNPGIGTIDASSGLVRTVSGGTATIVYTLPTGCATMTVITVNPSPSVIFGQPYICVGHTDTLFDAIPDGTWTSSNPAVATIVPASWDLHRAIVTPVITGSVTITYTTLAGCSITTTLGPVPPITGVHNVCAWGDTMHISDIVTYGLYTSVLATVTNLGGGDGILLANAPGTASVTYILPTGCATTSIFTVNPLPALIMPPPYTVCTGSTITLTDATPGGYWSSEYPAYATVGYGTGIVTGMSLGATRITYTVAATGCYTDTSVYDEPPITPITGTAAVCAGQTTALSDATTGGTWSSSSPAIATVGVTGIVTGVSAGTAVITYMLPGGCYATMAVTVNGLPVAIAGPTTVCTGGTITLTDATADGIWSSSDITIATIGSTSGILTGTALITNTVTVTYTSAAGCAITDTITVYSTSDPCSPCILGPAYVTLSGTISSDLGLGHYYFADDVTITGNRTFTGAVIQIAPGKTIKVDHISSLTLDSCHLFGSCQMWNGIVLQPGPGSGLASGRLTVTGGTLIEDAITAVYIYNAATTPYGGATYNFVSDNAIFNRNITSIDIETFSHVTTGAYPFLIRNTVITSRDMQTAMGGSYPGTWPTTAQLKTTWAYPDTFTPPFNIYNPYGAPSGGAYNSIVCKNNRSANTGIRLNGVGAEDYGSGTEYGGIPVPDAYHEIVIGDETPVGTNDYQNLMDNLNYGVYGTNSNFSCINNAFTGMQPLETPYPSMAWVAGNGVYAIVNDDNLYHKRLRVYTPSEGTFNNVFYGFRAGIECYNYFELYGQNTYMINANRGSHMLNNMAQYGYVVSTAKFDTFNISYNTISNINSGIAMWETHDAMGSIYSPTPQLLGVVTVDYNVIQAHPLGYSYITNQFVSNAISIQNLFYFFSTIPASDMNVSGNVLNDVYNGIYMNHIVLAQNPTTHANSITMRRAGTSPHWLQFGINHTACTGSVIAYNDVAGSDASVAFTDSLRAFYAASNSSIHIGCNTEENIGRGFEFFLHNFNTRWSDNTLTNNLKGYVLNGAVIGDQGGLGYPLGNIWAGSTWDGSGSAWQTYEINSVTTSSKLYVDTGLYSSLIYNWGNPVYLRYQPDTSIIATTPTGIGPVPCPERLHMWFSRALFEHIAKQEVPYVNNVIPNNWVGQYQVWQDLQGDTTADSSAVLQMFDSLASYSRYAFLTSIETALATGDFGGAITLLNSGRDTIPDTDSDYVTNVRLADNASATPIVENYMSFYREYINYMNGSLSGSDSLQIMALAQLCPEINGTIVYQARALYSFIYSDLTLFNDDSCISIDSTYIGERHGPTPTVHNGDSGTQQYRFYPNPNDGNILLMQMITDEQPVTTEIWDAVGRNIYKQSLTFNGGNYKLQLGNISPGLYLMQLRDAKGREFRFKFVVE